MSNGEWSLISFAILSQLSVGLKRAFGFILFAHQSVYGNLNSGISFLSPEFYILLIIMLATLTSFLHLGSPGHSFNTLNNLSGSWISKEILMLTVFGLSILLIMTCRALNWSGDVSKILFIFSGLSGVLLILSMSGIYMISTIPAWNGFYTPFSFLFD